MDEKQGQPAIKTARICNKIRRALSLGLATRMPYKQNQGNSMRSLTISTMPQTNNVSQIKKGSIAIPIEYERSIHVEHGKNIIKQRYIEVQEGKAMVTSKLKHTRSESDERFSDYINRAKKTITKTSSDTGLGRVTRLGSVNNKASAYIYKTRQRFGAGFV